MGGYTDPLFTHLNRNYNDSRGTIVLLLNVVFEAANTCWTESHSVSHSLNLFFSLSLSDTFIFVSLVPGVVHISGWAKTARGECETERRRRGKQRGVKSHLASAAEESFSFSKSVLIEEREQPGSPAENETGAVRWDGSFQNTLITHYSKLLPITPGEKKKKKK